MRPHAVHPSQSGGPRPGETEADHGHHLDHRHRIHRRRRRQAADARAQRAFGFVLTTILGIVGAFVATFLGQQIGWYRAGEGAGLIGAVVGAVIVLVIWGAMAGRRDDSARF